MKHSLHYHRNGSTKLNARIKQKIENTTAAYWARNTKQGKARTVSECEDMVKVMYGIDAVPVARNYIVKNLCNIAEGRPIVRLTGDSNTPSIARGDSVEDCYVDASEIQRQFSAAVNDRSNKE